MDIRVLRYFLAVAEERNITRAAEVMLTTQSNLSRQLADLEREVGCKLFERGGRRITLTEEGLFLRRRASEIVELADRTQHELSTFDDTIAGVVHIGAIESRKMNLLARAMDGVRCAYPGIRFDIMSGSNTELADMLERGLLDFALFVEPVDLARYDHLRLPGSDVFGALVRHDSKLAKKDAVTPDDLRGERLLVAHQQLEGGVLSSWFGCNVDALDVVATYNLITTPAMMVEAGMGCAFTFADLVMTGDGSQLAFRPLSPRVEANLSLVWKRGLPLTRAARLYLDQVKAVVGRNAG